MSIRTVVSFDEQPSDALLEAAFADQPAILEVLGDEYEMALRLSDLFQVVKEEMANVIDQESELTIEVTAALDLEAKAEGKLLIFNVSGAAVHTNRTTVSLKTKVKPNKGNTNRAMVR